MIPFTYSRAGDAADGDPPKPRRPAPAISAAAPISST